MKVPDPQDPRRVAIARALWRAYPMPSDDREAKEEAAMLDRLDKRK